MIQQIVVALIGLLCLGIIGKRIYDMFNPKEPSNGCSGCKACPGKKQS